MSLGSRHLEEKGIPTVIIGSALDIVEHCGVARFLFSHFPLGNPCGPPYQRQAQARIAELALDLLANAEAPRTTVTAPLEWPNDPGWRERFHRVRPEDSARLLAEGAARRQQRVELRKR